MKLRIHKDSIRFRFAREEVLALSRGQTLEECVSVGPLESQRLSYRIVPDPDVPYSVSSGPPGIRAEFEANRLTISVPCHALEAWHQGPQLALEGEQAWSNGALRILLEKDLQRLNSKEGEASTAVYPNPLFGKVRCDHP